MDELIHYKGLWFKVQRVYECDYDTGEPYVDGWMIDVTINKRDISSLVDNRAEIQGEMDPIIEYEQGFYEDNVSWWAA